MSLRNKKEQIYVGHYIWQKILMDAALAVLSPSVISDTHMLFLSTQSILLNWLSVLVLYSWSGEIPWQRSPGGGKDLLGGAIIKIKIHGWGSYMTLERTTDNFLNIHVVCWDTNSWFPCAQWPGIDVWSRKNDRTLTTCFKQVTPR